MDDKVYRQAAIDAVCSVCGDTECNIFDPDNKAKLYCPEPYAIMKLPSAELELEELKAEADKLGYKLIKKPEKVKLLPCSCGYKKKPVEWVKASGENGGWFYKCDNCDKKSEVVNTKIGAKRAWNRMILKDGESE